MLEIGGLRNLRGLRSLTISSAVPAVFMLAALVSGQPCRNVLDAVDAIAKSSDPMILAESV